MRKILTGLVAFVAMIIPFAGSAENRWSIYGGGSISHLCRQGRVFKGISNDGIFGSSRKHGAYVKLGN